MGGQNVVSIMKGGQPSLLARAASARGTVYSGLAHGLGKSLKSTRNLTSLQKGLACLRCPSSCII